MFYIDILCIYMYMSPYYRYVLLSKEEFPYILAKQRRLAKSWYNNNTESLILGKMISMLYVSS